MHPEQIKAFRRMTPAEKLALAERAWFDARALKAARLRVLHPECPESRIEQKVREVFLHARS